jgi:hypothetical protein
MNIVIPTYARSNNFKTIKFLKTANVPDEWITIFLASEEEKIKYLSTVGDNNYNWVVGVLGIRNQRNFITDYFDEDQIIISMDDDINEIKHGNDKPFMEWVKECIDYLNDNKLGLLSVPASSNPYFFECRNKSISFRKGNYLAVGVFHIYKNHKGYKMTIDCVEDYDRSLIYLKHYGANARYLDVFLKTVYWGKGGLTGQRTKEKYIFEVNKLLDKYPNVLKTTLKLIKQLDKVDKIPIVSILRKLPDSFFTKNL